MARTNTAEPVAEPAPENPPETMPDLTELIEAAAERLVHEAKEEMRAEYNGKLEQLTNDLSTLITDSFASITPGSLSSFDPNKYLTKVSGSDYLEAKWRVFWFRSENPQGKIETKLIEHNQDNYDGSNKNNPFALVRARVTRQDGGVATAYGSETQNDFRDYIEKAETKAIGRALAMAGYGTQFSSDISDGSGRDRPVDSPVDRSQNRPVQMQNPEGPSTPGQHKFIADLLRQQSETPLSDEDIDMIASKRMGHIMRLPDLKKGEAGNWIEELKAGKSAAPAQNAPTEGAPTAEKKQSLDEIDANVIGFSKIPFAQLRYLLLLDKPLNMQTHQWRLDAQLVNDAEKPEQMVREGIREMVLQAVDAIRIARNVEGVPAQEWRFAELAKDCRYEAALAGIEESARRNEALLPFVVAAIEGARRENAKRAAS